MRQTNLKHFLLLNLLMLIYSLSPICSKLASRELFFSLRFFLFYCSGIVVLGVYALFWQQVIKHISLTAAYANKAVTVIWGMLWGALLFGEKITLQNGIGAVMIIAGVVLFVFSDSKEARGDAGR